MIPKMNAGTTGLFISLEESLRPLWMLTRYAGILLDWCNEDKNRGRKTKIIFFSLILLNWNLHVATIIYDLVELATEMTCSDFTLTHLFEHVMVIFLHLLNLLVQSHYLMKNSLYLSFFREWGELKLSALKPKAINDLKRIIRATYSMYLIKICFSFMVLLALPLYYGIPDLPFTFPLIKKHLGNNNKFLYYLLAFYEYGLLLLFVMINDVVPIFAYNYIGFTIKNLEVEIVEIFKRMLPTKSLMFNFRFTTKIRNCWMSYEIVHQFGNRANRLFGFGFLANQLILLIFVCSTLYRVLDGLREGFKVRGSYIILLMDVYRCFIYSFRLIYINLKLSTVLESTKQLRNRMASLLIQHWEGMTEEEREIAMALVNRLHQNPLAAAPLGLYNISYSVFPILLSLIVSNVTILMQSPVQVS